MTSLPPHLYSAECGEGEAYVCGGGGIGVGNIWKVEVFVVPLCYCPTKTHLIHLSVFIIYD